VAPEFGAIEAGGTKFICAVGTGPDQLRTTRIPTTSPDETIGQILGWFKANAPDGLRSVGIASFGPVDLDHSSPTWGYITSTPKIPWRDFNLAGAIGNGLGVRVAFDTDANAALLGEIRWGAAKGVTSCVYMTVGTGIGGGAVSGGFFLNGRTHPEMGHIRVPHNLMDDPFAGICPFHGDCLEGLASGPAIARRWNQAPETLPPDHPAWDLEANYLAGALATLACILSPQRVILGGGVMQQFQLFPSIRTRLSNLLAGYIPVPEVLPAKLGNQAGILGALALAQSLASR
jgi:fructokinase